MPGFRRIYCKDPNGQSFDYIIINTGPHNIMSTELTELVIIMDRSGSMAKLAKDMEGGVFKLIADQAAQPGYCKVSYYVFDNMLETVFQSKPAIEITERDIKLEPRGSTALNDAIGTVLNSLAIRLDGQSTKPDKTIILVVTDGFENASKEYTKTQVADLVAKMEKDRDWQFCFLAADMKGFTDGAAITGMTVNKSNAIYDSKKIQKEFSSRISSAVTNYRSRGGSLSIT